MIYNNGRFIWCFFSFGILALCVSRNGVALAYGFVCAECGWPGTSETEITHRKCSLCLISTSASFQFKIVRHSVAFSSVSRIIFTIYIIFSVFVWCLPISPRQYCAHCCVHGRRKFTERFRAAGTLPPLRRQVLFTVRFHFDFVFLGALGGKDVLDGGSVRTWNATSIERNSPNFG